MRINRKKLLILILIFITAVTVVTAVFCEQGTECMRYLECAEKWSKEYDVDVYWVLATIQVESGGRSSAVSTAGAVGLMQLMPDTAKWLAEKLDVEHNDFFDVDTNIRLGTAYLGYLSNKFEGDYIFCAYNAGEGVVQEWIKDGKGIVYLETQEYLKKINRTMEKLKNTAYLY